MHCQPQKNPLVRPVSGVLSAAAFLVMTACGSDDDANRVAPDGDGATGGTASELPAPEGAIGSVTGMPANPGPGTSRITPVASAGSTRGAWADDTYEGAYAETDGIEAMDVQPSLPADAPPIILVPEVPREPLAIDIEPDAPAPTAPQPEPTGTEAATESTTFVTEPAEQDD